MPELPEVETTRRGIAPFVEGRVLRAVTVREPRLRWPVDARVGALRDQAILGLHRRAKYLLMTLDGLELGIHLGMSGTLRVVQADTPLRKHDHIDLLLDSGMVLRFNDPRRFGAVLYLEQGLTHPLLASLGPEPLGPECTSAAGAARCR